MLCSSIPLGMRSFLIYYLFFVMNQQFNCFFFPASLFLSTRLEECLLETCDERIIVLDLVREVRQRVLRCCQLSEENLRQSKAKTKTKFDKKARHHESQPRKQVFYYFHFKATIPCEVQRALSSCQEDTFHQLHSRYS